MKYFQSISTARWYPYAMWLYALLSGLLIVVAFPPKVVPHLEWVALVPFFILLLLPARNGRVLFFRGWLAGLTVFGTYIFWFFDTIPLSWIGISNLPAEIALVGVTWFLAIAYFALSFGVFLVFAKRFLCTAHGITLFILIGWPLLEYMRTLGYPLHPYIWGPGNIFGDNTGFLLLGYTIADYASLRQLASILGVYGLGVVVLVPNIVVFLLFQEWVRNARFCIRDISRGVLMTISILSVFFIILVSIGAQVNKLHIPTYRNVHVAILQTNFTLDDWLLRGDAGYQRHIREISLRLINEVMNAEQQPDIIVMPEGVSTLFGDGVYPSLSAIQDVLGEEVYRLVIDPTSLKTSEYVDKNTTLLFDNISGVRGVYEKQFLMPWGEYMPYATDWGINLFARSSGLFSRQFFREAGSGPSVFETPLGRIGVLTCSELLSPMRLRDVAREQPEVVIFSSSEAIIRGSERLHAQDLAMAKIHAAQLKKPIVFATNGGRSFAVDASGELIWESDAPQHMAIIIPVKFNREVTIGGSL